MLLTQRVVVIVARYVTKVQRQSNVNSPSPRALSRDRASKTNFMKIKKHRECGHMETYNGPNRCKIAKTNQYLTPAANFATNSQTTLLNTLLCCVILGFCAYPSMRDDGIHMSIW